MILLRVTTLMPNLGLGGSQRSKLFVSFSALNVRSYNTLMAFSGERPCISLRLRLLAVRDDNWKMICNVVCVSPPSSDFFFKWVVFVSGSQWC